MRRICFAAGLAASVAISSHARAETLPPLTTEQSASLGRALSLWTRGLLGDTSSYSARPAEGFYALEIPIKRDMAGLGASLDGGPATARVTQDASGIWHFEDIAYPSPLRTTVRNPDGGKPTVTVQTILQQSGSAVIDPTLATPSHWELISTGIEQRGDGGTTDALKVGRAATREEWLPAGGTGSGRVDTAMVSRADDMTVHALVPAEGGEPDRPMDVTMRQATATFATSDADLERLSRFVREAIAFVGEMRPREQDDLTPEQRVALHRLVGLSRDLAREAKMSLAAETIAATFAGQRVTLQQMAFEQRLATPAGKLDFRLKFQMAGLGLPGGLPPAARDLIPRKLVIAPYVSGTPIEDVYALLDRLIDDSSDPNAMSDDAQARLAKAPITTGFDELSFDLGPAAITGHGRIVASGAADADGTAVVQATGLDALIRKANGDPMLKQATPVLIFLKGIGEQDGEKIVWNVVYKDGALSVNGTDMSSMIPGK